mgnify:CR=1 FL=1
MCGQGLARDIQISFQRELLQIQNLKFYWFLNRFDASLKFSFKNFLSHSLKWIRHHLFSKLMLREFSIHFVFAPFGFLSNGVRTLIVPD